MNYEEKDEGSNADLPAEKKDSEKKKERAVEGFLRGAQKDKSSSAEKASRKKGESTLASTRIPRSRGGGGNKVITKSRRKTIFGKWGHFTSGGGTSGAGRH